MTEKIPPLPRKVLAKAQEYGVHNDCLAADYDGACEVCRTHIHFALDFFYHDATSTADLVGRIIQDLLTDLRS